MGNSSSVPQFRVEINKLLHSEKDLSDDDRQLLMAARSQVTKASDCTLRDFELTVALSKTELKFKEGNGSTKLVVQRDKDNDIEAIYRSKSIVLYVEEGMEKVVNAIWDFFLNKAIPEVGGHLLKKAIGY